MKALMVMFDSLNRNFLSAYGNDWTHTPNFRRLAEKTVTFETSYVCSMPCMPARRDLHTGRPNFLHRSWGPLEPWDDSCIARMKASGVYTHISTDHQHYWEPGAGGNYLHAYNTHAMIRGQEGDPYTAMLPPPAPEPHARQRNAGTDSWSTQDRINRMQCETETDMPQAKTFADGLDFLDRHADQDNWFLQIETFDPHEPFFTQPEFKKMYADHYEKAREMLWDWPPYEKVKEPPEEVEHMRLNYAALVSMCDAYLGEVLDAMDRHDLWKDTMLIVWTDHGFLLGEHDCWAKCWMPFYEEVAHTPFFVWDPRCRKAGERRQALVQPSIDLGPTLLAYFGLEPLEHATGYDLARTFDHDAPVRETGIFGIHGGQVNITDGKHVYMRGVTEAGNRPLNNYTLMPAHMRIQWPVEDLQNHDLSEPFSFMKGVRPLRIPCDRPLFEDQKSRDCLKTMLFDLERDPGQMHPVEDPETEAHFQEALHHHLLAVDAPAEQWKRLGLEPEWSKNK
ncbi:MAG: sulfatase [Verrucomicrobia bacterium]|nr:sulfatase [Verrucomicrobiota bacterium]MCH8512612.1 sulfatase [Kiritimatiellia bacterium]